MPIVTIRIALRPTSAAKQGSRHVTLTNRLQASQAILRITKGNLARVSHMGGDDRRKRVQSRPRLVRLKLYGRRISRFFRRISRTLTLFSVAPGLNRLFRKRSSAPSQPNWIYRKAPQQIYRHQLIIWFGRFFQFDPVKVSGVGITRQFIRNFFDILRSLIIVGGLKLLSDRTHSIVITGLFGISAYMLLVSSNTFMLTWKLTVFSYYFPNNRWTPIADGISHFIFFALVWGLAVWVIITAESAFATK